MKKHVFRVGDVVEIVNPLFVKRVGYPKCIDDFVGEAKAKLIEVGLLSSTSWTRADERFAREYARVLLRKNGWGGNERSLHTVKRPDLAGLKVKIINKKIAKTGFRFPARFYSQDDWEPGGLAQCTTHVLLSVWSGGFREITKYTDDSLIISSKNVKVPNE